MLFFYEGKRLPIKNLGGISMSHIGNKLRAGFFATPQRQGDYIIKLLNVEGSGAWLDPTCGEGAILYQLAWAFRTDDCIIATYGVELDKARAEKADEVLDCAINAPIETMAIQHDAFSLLFLNPPYDFTMKGVGDTSAERKEYVELLRNTKYLKEGGILIYIIPSYRYADPKIARFLATQFEEIGIMRFSEEDYDDFRQCIVIARKKSGKFKDFNQKLFEFLLQMDNEEFVQSKVASIEQFIGRKTWNVPSGDIIIRTFHSRFLAKADFAEGIRFSKGFQAFKERTKPRTLEIGGQPAIPINQGQMMLLLGSGGVNGLVSSGDHLHAVQGLEIVSKEETKEEHVRDDGSKTTIVKQRTKRSVSVKIITPSGIVRKLM
jgi:hypothetical protein